MDGPDWMEYDGQCSFLFFFLLLFCLQSLEYMDALVQPPSTRPGRAVAMF